MSKNICIGLDISANSIRAVKLQKAVVKKVPQYLIKGSHEVLGDFSKKKSLVEALNTLKTEVHFTGHDHVSVSVSGKQVHVVQFPFRRLPEDEMKNALRFEIRQSLPFDAMGAALEYQWIAKPEDDAEAMGSVVTAVMGSRFYAHQLECFEEAGIKMQAMDVLPLCVSNSLWARKMELEPGIAQVALYFSEDACQLVVDGENVPFYTRNIMFKGEKLFGPEAEEEVEEYEVKNALDNLTQELRRSLSYYEKNHQIENFGKIVICGKYQKEVRLRDALENEIELPFEARSVMMSLQGNGEKVPDFSYEVAATLAMEGLGA